MGLQIMMLPWFALGHILPFMNLAEKGHKIKFLVPTKSKSKSKIQHLNRYPDLITFHNLTIPHVDGLPAGAETTSDVSPSLIPLINSTRPNVVIHDFSHWLTQITKPLHIKVVNFVADFASLFALGVGEFVEGTPKSYPSKTVVLRSYEKVGKSELSSLFGENITFLERLATIRDECDMFAIRTCREMEGHFCDYIASLYNKPVSLTGPILHEQDTSALDENLAKWLHGFERGSVVLCVFGSEYVLEKDQFQEFLLGFESSGYPFLIALKPPIGTSTVEEAFPIGFEERTKGRGLMCGGWVQQQAILKHPSVGCFVNHCGASSIWESLLSDCQIVVVPPVRTDFIMHARLMAAELEVVVEVQKEESGWVSKEKLSQAIRSVMDRDSEIGQLIKKNHAKLKETLDSPGFMSGYFDNFVRDLEELVA